MPPKKRGRGAAAADDGASGRPTSFADLPIAIAERILDAAVPRLDSLHMMTNVIRESSALLLVNRQTHAAVIEVWTTRFSREHISGQALDVQVLPPQLPPGVTADGISRANVAQLQLWLAAAGLAKGGRKAVLQQRLAALLPGHSGAECAASTAAPAAASALRRVPLHLKSKVMKEAGKRVCLSVAKQEYRVSDADLERLPYEEAENPHSRFYAPMKLYKLVDIIGAASKRWGGDVSAWSDRSKRAPAVQRTPAALQSDRRGKVLAALRRHELDTTMENLLVFRTYITSGRGGSKAQLLAATALLAAQRRQERRAQVVGELTARRLQLAVSVEENSVLTAYVMLRTDWSMALEELGELTAAAAARGVACGEVRRAVAAAGLPEFEAYADAGLRGCWLVARSRDVSRGGSGAVATALEALVGRRARAAAAVEARAARLAALRGALAAAGLSEDLLWQDAALERWWDNGPRPAAGGSVDTVGSGAGFGGEAADTDVAESAAAAVAAWQACSAESARQDAARAELVVRLNALRGALAARDLPDWLACRMLPQFAGFIGLWSNTAPAGSATGAAGPSGSRSAGPSSSGGVAAVALPRAVIDTLDRLVNAQRALQAAGLPQSYLASEPLLSAASIEGQPVAWHALALHAADELARMGPLQQHPAALPAPPGVQAACSCGSAAAKACPNALCNNCCPGCARHPGGRGRGAGALPPPQVPQPAQAQPAQLAQAPPQLQHPAVRRLRHDALLVALEAAGGAAGATTAPATSELFNTYVASGLASGPPSADGNGAGPVAAAAAAVLEAQRAQQTDEAAGVVRRQRFARVRAALAAARLPLEVGDSADGDDGAAPLGVICGPRKVAGRFADAHIAALTADGGAAGDALVSRLVAALVAARAALLAAGLAPKLLWCKLIDAAVRRVGDGNTQAVKDAVEHVLRTACPLCKAATGCDIWNHAPYCGTCRLVPDAAPVGSGGSGGNDSGAGIGQAGGDDGGEAPSGDDAEPASPVSTPPARTRQAPGRKHTRAAAAAAAAAAEDGSGRGEGSGGGAAASAVPLRRSRRARARRAVRAAVNAVVAAEESDSDTASSQDSDADDADDAAAPQCRAARSAAAAAASRRGRAAAAPRRSARSPAASRGSGSVAADSDPDYEMDE